ncbi:DUF485 domain-containing protein [Streptomyces sp. NPDC052015]|uniref:DUF485 domain-containing protein n=1 Tax=Streptomyces sp. NPDC052015 TaxID=3154755 RepID=UPI003426A56D
MSMFGGSPAPPPRASPGVNAVAYMQATAQFQRFRRRRRSVAFTTAAVVVTVHLGVVLLSSAARDLMALRVIGHVTVGLLLALIDGAAAPMVVFAYRRYTRTRLDPLADRVTADFERRGENQ